MSVELTLADTGNGIAGPGEYAVDSVSGTLYRVTSIHGQIIAEQHRPHRQMARGERVDWTDEVEPVCSATPTK